MKKILSVVLFAAGFLLLAAFLLLLGYSYGVYTTRTVLSLVYTSAPYSLEVLFLSVVFLLPGAVCLAIAFVLKRLQHK